MSINLTGFDDSVIFVINPTLHVSFVFLCLPALLLFTLCVIALLLTKSFDINLRVILVNVFAADISVLIGSSVLFLGHPARLKDELDVNYSCNFTLSAIFTGGTAKSPATSIYAIVVFIYTKYGPKKIRLWVIVLSIVPIWVASLCFGSLPYSSTFAAVSNRGFCYIETQSLLLTLFTAMLVLLSVVGLGVTSLFGILTFCYVKKNTLRESTDAHKAAIKILAYITVGTVMSFIINTLPPLYNRIENYLSGRESSMVTELVLYYVSHGLFKLPLIVIPLLTLTLLKSVRGTVREILSVCLCCQQPMQTTVAPDITHQQRSIEELTPLN